MRRRTIAAATQALSGIGVRSGAQISVSLMPAEACGGLRIQRTDVGACVPLHLDRALDLPNCTAVGTCEQDATLFVEHLMAALHMHCVTDVTVRVDGPEIPLLDGSALPWSRLIADAGVRELDQHIEPLTVTAPLRVEESDKWVSAEPAPTASYTFDLKYENPLIGHEVTSFLPAKDSFDDALAPARTFALFEEIQQAIAAGMLRGGTQENCRIVYADRYSDPPTLPQEFARHKIVDMLGDLYLLGRPVVGRFMGYRSGHAHNRALLCKLAKHANV